MSVTTYASNQFSKAIVELLNRISDDSFVKMASIAYKLASLFTSDEEILGGIEKVRKLLEDKRHPTRVLFRRVLEYLPPENRVKLFHTLFHNAWFMGAKKRDEFEKKYGFRPPFILILSPTFRCNLRCKGCYTLGYGMQPELPYEVVDRILKECEELGIYFVTILGGEPLIYPHLFRMIENHPDIFFQVYTNGTLMTRDKARRFRELGNVAVVVSIEGDEKETDSWRGKGVYRKIMEAFEHLRAERVIFGTSATVTRHNVYKVSSFEFIDRMIELGSFAQMYFLYVPVNGRADLSLMVTPEQRNHLRRQVLIMRNTRPIFILDFWNDGPYVGGCIAGGRRYFHINAKGDIEPCVYTHIATHNIYNSTIKEALSSPLFVEIRKRQPHNPNHLRPCMIIDNPHVMREIIDKIKPYFTHEGADEIYTKLKDKMDEYAERYGILADRIWKEEYGEGKKKPDIKLEDLKRSA